MCPETSDVLEQEKEMEGTLPLSPKLRHLQSVTKSLLLVAALSAAPAKAENFIKVEVEADPLIINRNELYVDVDSFKPDQATRSTYFTYRTVGKSMGDGGKSMLEVDAIATCEKFALVDLRYYGIGAGSRFLTQEMYSEEKGWLKDPVYQARYLNNSAESAMLLQVCRQLYPQVVEAMMSRPQTGCLEKGTFNYAACALGERNRYNLRLVKSRMELVGEYCGDMDYLQGRLMQLQKDVELCGDRTECFAMRGGGFVHGVAGDAGRISEWLLNRRSRPLDHEQACRTQQRVDENARYQKKLEDQWAAEKKASDAFWACANQKIKDLDDGVSDGASIAKVVFNRCGLEISDVLEAKKTPYRTVTREEYISQSEPGVIEAVLKHRKKKK